MNILNSDYWQAVIPVVLIILFWWHITRKPSRVHVIAECTEHFFSLRKSIMNCRIEEIGSYSLMIDEFVEQWTGKDTAGLAKDYELELRKILESVGDENELKVIV